MKTAMKSKRYKTSVNGFTFAELLVVLAIIAVLTAVTVPYATRYGKNLKLEQESLNLATAVNYLVDLAKRSQRVTRLVLIPNQSSYAMKIASIEDSRRFEPVVGYLGRPYLLGSGFRFDNITGFTCDADLYYLLFDPARSWPKASFALVTKEGMKTIRIDGMKIEAIDSDG